MRTVTLHPWCARKVEPGTTLRISTAEFPQCWYCGNFDLDYNDLVEVELPLVLLSEEDCTCGGWIRHRNGGNYHYSEFVVSA